ncbi:unnamed protein product, partial [marine sediment metagenome]
GNVAAFEAGGEYFTARVDLTNTALREISRGYFYDASGNAITPEAIADDDTITLMKLGYLFLGTDNVIIVTYNAPTYSTAEPASPATGDMWFNLNTKKWMQRGSTSWNDATCAFIGEVITDDSAQTVGARPADFYANFNDDNTFDIESVETSVVQIKSKSQFNKLSVYGNELKFWNNPVIWDISDLDSGESEVASVDVFAYIKENGDRVMSLLAPYNNLGDMRGYYHPYEAWRYVGKVFNDSGSDFELFSVRNSPENLLINT